jgi:serine/threonine protein kinase
MQSQSHSVFDRHSIFYFNKYVIPENGMIENRDPLLSNKHLNILQNHHLSLEEANRLIDYINKNFQNWISAGKDVYIKSDKFNHSGGAIEYHNHERRVVVHIRGDCYPGRRISLRGFVGQGSFGIVRDTIELIKGGAAMHAGSLYVQKKVRKKKFRDDDLTALILNFRREAEVYQHLSFSPYIVQGTPSHHGMILEKMNLGNALEIKFNLRLTKLFIENTLKALVDLNTAGFVHNDIKLENIYLHKKEDGTLVIKVGDLGFASKIDQEDQAQFSPKCISPTRFLNILKCLKSDPRDDVFSAGVTFCAVIRGALPCFTYTNLELVTEFEYYNLIPSNQTRWSFIKAYQKQVAAIAAYANERHSNDPQHVNYFLKQLLSQSEDRPDAKGALELFYQIKKWDSLSMTSQFFDDLIYKITKWNI